MTDPLLLSVDVPPDIGQPATCRGLAVLGIISTVAAASATAGYVSYSRRHHNVPDSPIPFMRHYSHDAGIYGAWRWGLMGLGVAAIFGSMIGFALGA